MGFKGSYDRVAAFARQCREGKLGTFCIRRIFNAPNRRRRLTLSTSLILLRLAPIELAFNILSAVTFGRAERIEVRTAGFAEQTPSVKAPALTFCITTDSPHPTSTSQISLFIAYLLVRISCLQRSSSFAELHTLPTVLISAIGKLGPVALNRADQSQYGGIAIRAVPPNAATAL